MHGTGPLVVLAHGMGENRASFRHLVPRLVAAGYRVAAVDVRGHGDSSPHWPSYAPAEVGRDLLAQAIVLRSPRLFGMFHRTLFPCGRPADDAAYRKEMVARLRGRMAAVRGVVEPVQPHWTARARDVRQPVLVLMGTKDPDFPDPGAEARAARRQFATAEARMIADSGHYPHADQPEATAADLIEFLAVTTRA